MSSITPKQIAQLKKQFGSISRIDVSSPEYKKMRELLNSLPKEDLNKLASAGIPFVSRMAKMRAGLKEGTFPTKLPDSMGDYIKKGTAKQLKKIVGKEPGTEFVVYSNPNGNRPGEDKVFMATLKNGKIADYHGTHANLDRALKFAKSNGLTEELHEAIDVKELVKQFNQFTRRTAHYYPRKGTVSIDGRPRKLKDAISIMQDALDDVTKRGDTRNNAERDPKRFDEASPPGWGGTVKAMKKHKDIKNNKKKNPYALAWWMKKKGYKSHKKPDGTDKNESYMYESIKVGSRVHLGFGTKGGAGYEGTVIKIDGDRVHIRSDAKDKYGNKEYSGPMRLVTPIKEGFGSSAGKRQMIKNLVNEIADINSPELFDKVVRRIGVTGGSREAKLTNIGRRLETLETSALEGIQKMVRKNMRESKELSGLMSMIDRADNIEHIAKTLGVKPASTEKATIDRIKKKVKEINYRDEITKGDRIASLFKKLGESTVSRTQGTNPKTLEIFRMIDGADDLTGIASKLGVKPASTAKGTTDRIKKKIKEIDYRDQLSGGNRISSLFKSIRKVNEASMADRKLVKHRKPNTLNKSVTAFRLVLPDTDEMKDKMAEVLSRETPTLRNMARLVQKREMRDNGEIVLSFKSVAARDKFRKYMYESTIFEGADDSFAGMPVFTVNEDDYSNCMDGRTKYERWSKRLNMENENNLKIKKFAHNNPGKPVIVRNEKTGEMVFLKRN